MIQLEKHLEIQYIYTKDLKYNEKSEDNYETLMK